MPAPDLPHIIIVVVVKLNVVSKGRVSILVMPWAIRLTIVIAMLVAPRMTAVAIMRIIIIVIHGRIVIGTFSIVILLLRLHRPLVFLLFPTTSLEIAYLLISLILQILIWLVPRFG